MVNVSREEGIIYEFNKENEAIKRVSSGTTVRVETYDCFQDQVQSPDDKITEIDWAKINPATGPVFVEGAMPGDVLKVTIDKIEIGDQGVMVVGPDLGAMGEHFTEMTSKILPIQGDKIIFNDVEVPFNKMIGVIGVAPEEGGVNSGTPGAHGGNMDNKMVTEGATLYFPVFTEGALFSLGDFHAAMGDGEICATGVEVPGAATVTLEVLKDVSLSHPILENEAVISTIVSAETLDDATKKATQEMIQWIVKNSNLSVEEATMLMSAVGDVGICQMVNPVLTARFAVPKWVFKQFNIQFIE